MRRLEGKTAFITGGSGGIGSATARRFASEGASVAIADIDEDAASRLAEEIGSQALGVHIDIGNERSVESAIQKAVDAFGKLDILFNNAALTDVATMSGDTNIVEMSRETWGRTLEVNLTGYMLCSRVAIPHMVVAGGGVIVNSASSGGLLADISRAAYGISKAGVISLTQYIATQHGGERIRCNAIAPGPIVTPHVREVAGVLLDKIARHMPMGELGEPDDAAALVTFLASSESKYINGQTIVIDGGMMAHHCHVRDMIDLAEEQ